ncbi:MAG: bifunctional oligoribonuclease/PAP phosphatase NrnA [Lachnospiraceae bacterium]|jgi:phosphoesterase RecJ-like protein|nr:bifunctional oligoribonuclease/PAP phosphatase NrnA [Lachnospiraceae bacterium]MCI8985460.1 bifunctional oligoribonuclease/PAP phosphatase NrnA [Lachnospiraceae bacterium]
MIRITEEVRNAGSIAVSGHIRPDGDCVGSVMGLYLYLKKELPEAEVDVYLEKPAEIFDCISHIEDIKSEFNNVDTGKIYDVFIVLDCADDRLGEVRVLYEKARKKINIDHHISNPGCGDVRIVEPERSSTAELLYDLMDPAALDEEIARALYIGIIHDTGVLRYSNTAPHTLQVVSELIKFGFDFSKIIDDTFYEKTYVQTQIMGRAILESVRFMHDKCIVSMVSRRMMDFYQVTPQDLDGIVNQLLAVKGVECAIFMYEIRTLEYKISMRSKGRVDVAGVAMRFGGGGHVRAAGCTMNGTYHDNINNLAIGIAEQLNIE